MRIAFSGTANVGKSTLLDACKRRWPMYSFPIKTYRDIIRENNLNHSSKTTEETQLLILDWMMIEHKKYPKGSKAFFDRCPWDNLAYTLYGNANGTISDEVTAATISFVRESMKNIDIIFWIKYNPSIKIVNDGLRDANLSYILETEKIFSDLYDQYINDIETDIFYPKEDCPAIIAIENDFTTIDDRLMFIGEFIDKNGDLIETKDSILSLENLELYKNLMNDQNSQKEVENKINEICKTLKK